MAKTLDQEFEGIKLKKKTFDKITKRVLNKYHKEYSFDKKNQESTIYNSKEISNIFNETFNTTPNTKEDARKIFSRELRKTKEYKKMNKINSSYLKGISFVMYLTIALVSFGTYALNKAFIKLDERNKQYNIFEQTFNDKLYKYGDTNNDGIISNNEKTNLALKILKEKGVLLQEDYNTFYGFPVPKHNDGNNFNIPELTNLVKDYKLGK